MRFHAASVGRLQLLTWLSLAALGASRPVAAASPDVRVRLLAPASAGAGTKAPLVLEMVLGRGWHVNSHTPSHAYLIPTTAEFSAPGGTFAEVRYPKHVARRFDFSDEPLAVYEGTVRFETELAIPGAAVGTVEVAGVVSYQACDDQQCFPPASVKVQATLAVAGPTSGGT